MASRDEIVALNRRWLDATNSGNFDAFDELVGANIVEHQPFPGKTADLKGVKEGFRELRAAFPDLKFTLEDQIVEGDKVAIRGTLSGTHKGAYLGIPATGKTFSIESFDIVRVENGKFVEHWGITDQAKMLGQLGVMPAPGG
jgi:steroid delta-isomerase-like uncharacterized protein